MQAQKRRERILARGDAGQKFIQKQLTKEEMKQTENDNLKDIQNKMKLNKIIDPCTHYKDDITNNEIPNHENGRLGDPFSNLLFGNINNNINDLNDLNNITNNLNNFASFGASFSQSFSSSFSPSESMNLNSNNGNNNMMNQEYLANEKYDKFISNLERIIHLIFVILFVLTLIFYPDIDIFGYDIESDTFTFFIACESVLCAIFFGYKYHRQYMIQKNDNVCYFVVTSFFFLSNSIFFLWFLVVVIVMFYIEYELF